MHDLARYGLPIAFLIAAGVTCLLLAFAPTAHTPGPDQMTGNVQVNEAFTVTDHQRDHRRRCTCPTRPGSLPLR